MDISMRLKRIATMVTPGSTVCDVGTDHGYLAIHLISEKIAPKVIAMDVAKGPLSKAQANVRAFALEDYIETRLSDGVEQLQNGEASTVIMAGMGGMLIRSLLEKGEDKLKQVDELILSPQTDIHMVRLYLWEHDYKIVEEDFILDEGKYYVIMKACHGKDDPVNLCELYYGRLLLQNRNPILQKYLENEYIKRSNILEGLRSVDTPVSQNRIRELEGEMSRIREGLHYYEV